MDNLAASECSPSPRDKIEYASTESARVNLSLTENPLGPSPKVLAALPAITKEVFENAHHYPLHQNVKALRREIAATHNISDKEVYVGGNGSVGVLEDIFNARLIEEKTILLTPESTFPAGVVLANNRCIGVESVPLDQNYRINFDGFKRTLKHVRQNHCNVGAIFICNPNNPTGLVEPINKIINLAEENPTTLVIVSEANIGFVHRPTLKKIGGSLLDQKALPPNILVVRSFSKAHGLAGMRVGYAVGDARVIKSLSDFKVPFSICDFQSLVALEALKDKDHIEKSRRFMEKEVPQLVSFFQEMDFPFVSNSESNLILAKIPVYFNSAQELASELHKKDCSVVPCGAQFGTTIADKHIRIAPNTPEINVEFRKILQEVCQNASAKHYSSAQRKIRSDSRSFETIITSSTPNLLTHNL